LGVAWDVMTKTVTRFAAWYITNYLLWAIEHEPYSFTPHG